MFVLVIGLAVIANEIGAGTAGVVHALANFRAFKAFLLRFKVKNLHFDLGRAKVAVGVSWLQNAAL
jgi:hypothetical protein